MSENHFEQAYSPKALGIELDADQNAVNFAPGTPEAIYAEAWKKCDSATVFGYVAAGGEPTFCGGAYIRIRPARGPFVAFLKKHGIGERGPFGGYEVSEFGKYHGQSADLSMLGCRAVAEVLNAHGIKTYAIEYET